MAKKKNKEFEFPNRIFVTEQNEGGGETYLTACAGWGEIPIDVGGTVRVGIYELVQHATAENDTELHDIKSVSNGK